VLSFGRGSPGRTRRMVFGILVLVLVLLDIGFAVELAVPYPDAVVQGRTLANSSALLVQALASVDKAYGPLQNRNAGSDGQDPDECFFLQDPKGDFEETIYCGGALHYKGCAQGCGGEVDFIFGQHFKVVEPRGTWVGMLVGRPQTFSYSEVVSGDRLWRPDGVTGSVINHGGGTLEVDVRNTIPDKVGLLLVVGGTTFALLVFLLPFLISPKPARYRPPAGLPAVREAWDNLGRLAFTPPLTPPSPVLLGARPGLSWASQDAPAEAATTSTKEQDADDKALVTVPAEPEVVPEPETAMEPRALVLGPLGVEGWAEPPARAKTTELAVYLALHSDRAVTAEHLRTAGWPYDPVRGDVALATVHQEVSRVRRCLGAQHLPEAKGGYQVVGVTSDWAEFQALVEVSRHVDAPESTAYLRRALFLIRGAPFAEVAAKSYGWAFEEIIVAEIEAGIAPAAHEMVERCLLAGEQGEAAWALRQGLLGCPKDVLLREDQLAVAATEGSAGVERAWRDVEKVLGPQGADSRLGEALKRARSRN
jgi:hypothetical protein